MFKVNSKYTRTTSLRRVRENPYSGQFAHCTLYLCSFPFGRCWSYSTWIYIDSFKAFLDSFSKYFSYLFPFRTSLPLSWNCFQPPESCSSFPIPLIYAKLMFVGFYSFIHSILSFNFYEGRYFKSNAVRKC